MPKCYQLIGVPGSGKTTWAKNQSWIIDCSYISTDKWIELISKELNKSYSEVFEHFMPIAVELLSKEVSLARDSNKNIIWDQTSTNKTSRYRKFNMLPTYEHIAVIFRTPSQDELTRRLNNRPGKNIPISVVEKMSADLISDPPSLDEGFQEIWHAN